MHQWFSQFGALVGHEGHRFCETVRMPHRVPVQGTQLPLKIWRAFVQLCPGAQPDQPARLRVNSQIGEVTLEAEGTKVKRWDDGKRTLDLLLPKLQQICMFDWLMMAG